MGPALLFSSFLTGATLALYHGSPLGHGFGKFVQVTTAAIASISDLVYSYLNTFTRTST